MRSMVMVAVLPLVLAACGDGGVPQPKAAATVGADGKDYRQAVAALSEPQQKVVLLRAILDANQTCQGVDTAVRQPDQDSRFVWLAKCTGASGQAWLVALAGDGTANVTGPIGAKTVPAGRATPG